jgi:hypothetical protein
MTIYSLYPTPFEAFSLKKLQELQDPVKWSCGQLERFVRGIADEESARILKHEQINGSGLHFITTKLRDPEAQLKFLGLKDEPVHSILSEFRALTERFRDIENS